MSQNYSFFMLKPDGVAKNLLPEVTSILQSKGIIIEKSVELTPNVDHWKEHYVEHCGKSFYEELCSEMADKPVIAMKVTCDSNEPCWKTCREVLGATDPKTAAENTIRGRYGASRRQNVAHASDSVESSKRELQLWNLA